MGEISYHVFEESLGAGVSRQITRFVHQLFHLIHAHILRQAMGVHSLGRPEDHQLLHGWIHSQQLRLVYCIIDAFHQGI